MGKKKQKHSTSVHARAARSPAASPEVVIVNVCAQCPFAWDGTDMGDRWRCTAVDLGAHFKALPRGNHWKRRPPAWCPLRRVDKLVKLELRSTLDPSDRHRSIKQCDAELRRSGPSAGRASDGDRWTCTCGRVFVHVCDEATGCQWELVP